MTTDRLEPLPSAFLNGDIPFRGSGTSSLRLRDYWRWSASSLLDNTARGVLAEFLVATALRAFVRERPRREWDAYDLHADVGGRDVTVEVKSSARVQSWAQRKLSPPRFSIAPTKKWNPETARDSDEALRADVYVFCLFDATSVDSHAAARGTERGPLAVPCRCGMRAPERKSVGWSRLSRFEACGFQDLRREFEAAVARLAGKAAGVRSSPEAGERSHG